MNTLVVYASHFGNTERLARSIAATLSAFGSSKAVPVDSTLPLDLDGVDIFIVASPTEGFRQMPTMRTFLDHLSCERLGQVCIACFDTRIDLPWPLNGSAARDIARQLRRKGITLLVPQKSFFVQRIKGAQGAVLLAGEADRAVRWALSTYETYAATHPRAAVHSA